MNGRKNFAVHVLMIVLPVLLLVGCGSTKVVNNYFYYWGFPYSGSGFVSTSLSEDVSGPARNPSATYNTGGISENNQVARAELFSIEPIKKLGDKLIALAKPVSVEPSKSADINLSGEERIILIRPAESLEISLNKEKKITDVLTEVSPLSVLPILLIAGGVSYMYLVSSRRKKNNLDDLTEDEWRGLKFFWKFLEGSLRKRGKL